MSVKETTSPASPASHLFLGTAGYAYPHWRKCFYPNGLPHANELKFYAQTFNTCEINTTFYGVPSEATIAGWIAQVQPVNPNFKFTLKMKKTVTHGGEGTSSSSSSSSNSNSSTPSAHPSSASSPNTKEHYSRPLHPTALAHELPLFFARASLLPPSLRGPILFQFPPSFPLDLPSLQRLATALSSLPPSSPPWQWQLAFEFRHPSWFCSETFSFLYSQGWALVLHALPQTKALTKEIEQLTSSSFVYLRLHGLKEEHAWDYSKEELTPYVEKVKRWREGGREEGGEGGKEGGKEGGRDVYVFFLNDAEGKAPENALVFGGMVAEVMGGGEKGPKKPQAGMQITKFFGVKPQGKKEGEGGVEGGGGGGKRKVGGEEGEEGAKRSKGVEEEEENPKEEEEGKRAGAPTPPPAAAATPRTAPSKSASPPPPSCKGGGNKAKTTRINSSNSSSSGNSSSSSSSGSTPRITQFFGRKKEEEKKK